MLLPILWLLCEFHAFGAAIVVLWCGQSESLKMLPAESIPVHHRATTQELLSEQIKLSVSVTHGPVLGYAGGH